MINHVIINDTIKELTNFLNDAEMEFATINPSLNNPESFEDLQILCSNVGAKIKSMLKYLQYNKVDYEKKDDIMKICKKLNALLNDCEKELEKIGVEKRHEEYEGFYGTMIKESKNEFFRNKQLLPNSDEIEKDFFDFIKVETQQLKRDNSDKTWFRIGVLFANGKAYDPIKENNASKTANELTGNKNNREWFSSTWGGNGRESFNIFKRQYAKQELSEAIDDCYKKGANVDLRHLKKLQENKIIDSIFMQLLKDRGDEIYERFLHQLLENNIAIN